MSGRRMEGGREEEKQELSGRVCVGGRMKERFRVREDGTGHEATPLCRT